MTKEDDDVCNVGTDRDLLAPCNHEGVGTHMVVFCDRKLSSNVSSDTDAVVIVVAAYEPPHGKTNNVVSEQARHKTACTATEAG